MRKVTTINLNGRAYQLEDAGYEDLQAYLTRSESRLSDNPDKTEVMADLEQAIADKCDKLLTEHKNVVTEAEVKQILKQMGEVETEGDEPAGAIYADDAKPRGKRLYAIREGAVLGGVCQGLAAYFGLDVVWMRLIFVVLAFITSGGMLLIYVIFWLLMPVARTKTELAEAYGKPVTAQEIVDQFKERAPGPEQRRRLANIANEVLRISIKVVGIISAIIFGLVSALWVGILWMLAFGHLQLYDQLAYVNGWRAWILATAVYIVIAAVAFGTYRACMRYSDKRAPSRAQAFTDGFIWVLWSIAITALLVFTATDGHNFVQYTREHNGNIHVGQSTICIDENRCAITPVQ